MKLFSENFFIRFSLIDIASLYVPEDSESS